MPWRHASPMDQRTQFIAESSPDGPSHDTQGNPGDEHAPRQEQHPWRRRPPLVIDMSTSATARVNVVAAASKGQPIPAGWALDRDGQPTTDPQRALEGTVAPLGGYKGTGLALMVEILAAGLTGANWSNAVIPMATNDGPPLGLGQLFLALAPARLGVSSFTDRLETMLKEMLTEEGVRVPGDRRHAARARAERDGVTVPSVLIERLKRYAGR